MMDTLSSALGKIEIHISKSGGHPPEFWAERAALRIMQVADTAPQPIRDQAYAFREQMQMIILGAINSALIEQKAYIAAAKKE